MTRRLATLPSMLVALLFIFSGAAQTSAQAPAPTAPGGPGLPGGPGGPPGAPGAPGQPTPLDQPQEPGRPTPAATGAQIFDFLGLGFGDPTGFAPGYYVAPSFGVSETYDDNIFLTESDRQDDFITRFTPGIRLGYVSAPLTLLGSYAFDIEVYAKESDLNNVGERQRGQLEFRYLPDPLLVLTLDANFARSNDPVDINRQGALLRRRGVAPSGVPVTEIRRGREETTTFTLSPAATYEFTPVWSGTAAYTFALTDTEDGARGTSHTLSLGASRTLSEKDTGSVIYSFSVFDTEGGDSTTSHTILFGWTRRVSELLTFGLSLGPRFSDDGDTGVDAGASVNYRLGRLTDLSLVYSRSQALVGDRSESATVDAVSAVISTRPLQFLQVSAGPTFNRISGNGGVGDVSIYGLDAAATYQFNRWLSGNATYRFSYQEGLGGDIFHNTLTIGLSVTQTIRVY
jgi:hypothetical protein